MSVARSTIAIGLLALLGSGTVQAKPKNAVKTLVGCVHGSANHYQLAVVTKKGKAKTYDIVTDRNLSADVGHTMEVHGTVAKGTIKGGSLKALGSTCS